MCIARGSILKRPPGSGCGAIYWAESKDLSTSLIGKHFQDGSEVAFVECVGESLRQRLDFIHAHRTVPPFCCLDTPYAGVTVIQAICVVSPISKVRVGSSHRIEKTAKLTGLRC